ncbi:hypothetical protein K1719_038548 [Acacia pycnantha]|nr:hypothetical protein K1719_038548 [Acacia pycnantha]
MPGSLVIWYDSVTINGIFVNFTWEEDYPRLSANVAGDRKSLTSSHRDLGNSNLSGHLVPELGKLEHLQYLELYKNNIQGTIPSELGSLKSLISLDRITTSYQGQFLLLWGR